MRRGRMELNEDGSLKTVPVPPMVVGEMVWVNGIDSYGHVESINEDTISVRLENGTLAHTPTVLVRRMVG